MQNKILGIGIDSVEIQRFDEWHTYSEKSLLRIFSPEEIEYCLACPIKTAERFAARFAAREALLKALSSAFPTIKFSLLPLCKAIQITKTVYGTPHILINEKLLHSDALKNIRCHISLTHTTITATAIIVIENNEK